jgi:site-specific DNA-methyltransferase (adenine-specific)
MMEPYYRDDIAGLALYHGEALDVLRALPDNTVDGVVTDPPYSSGGQFRGDRADDVTSKYVQSGTLLARPEFGGDNRDQRGYGYWCALWLSECLRIAREGAPICVFTDWRQLPTTTDVLQAGGWVWRGIVAWDKTEGARPAYGRFRAQCEYVVWGSKGPMALNQGGECLAGAYTIAVRQADKHHITGKPTELMRHIVRICPEGGVVLDPFAGSATTGVACWHERRRFIGVERERAYVEVAQRRLAKLAGQPRLLQDALPPRPRSLSLDEAEAAS